MGTPNVLRIHWKLHCRIRHRHHHQQQHHRRRHRHRHRHRHHHDHDHDHHHHHHHHHQPLTFGLLLGFFLHVTTASLSSLSTY